MKRIAFPLLIALTLFTTSCCGCGALEKAQSLIERGQELATSEVPELIETVEAQATRSGSTEETSPTPSSTEGEATPTPASAESDDPGTGSGDETVEIAAIEDLDSYRVEWTVKSQAPDDTGMVVGYTAEWVREPPARHVTIMLGGSPAGEFIAIGDQVWTLAGEDWVVTDEDATEEIFDGLAEAVLPDEEMKLVGQETVNGVKCKHYLHEFDGGTQKMHREVWVADQAGLPAAPIRALYRMEVESEGGNMTTVVEVNFYDINQPIDIQPPE